MMSSSRDTEYVGLLGNKKTAGG